MACAAVVLNGWLHKFHFWIGNKQDNLVFPVASNRYVGLCPNSILQDGTTDCIKTQPAVAAWAGCGSWQTAKSGSGLTV